MLGRDFTFINFTRKLLYFKNITFLLENEDFYDFKNSWKIEKSPSVAESLSVEILQLALFENLTIVEI